MIAAQMTLFLMGKFGSTGTFSCIYLYSSELYPTSLRFVVQFYNSTLRFLCFLHLYKPCILKYFAKTTAVKLVL